MKILLSYSKTHFDPKKSPDQQKHWGSSASILARSLHSILSPLGEVTYIDKSEYATIKGQSFDLFIGIQEHFTDILSHCTIKKSILFAVNMHPYERNRILRSFMREQGINESDLAGYELIDSVDMTSAIDRADHILCVGNVATMNSFLLHGVPKTKIKVLNYATLERSVATSLPHSARRHYIHVASEIGIRKGFDIVYSLLTNDSFLNNDFHFDLVGKTTSEYYEKKVRSLQELLGDKMTYHGWVDSHSDKYTALLQRNDYLLYPALEEGQAGSALEALSCGVVPLLTEATGIDFSPLGVLETTTHSEHNTSVLQKSYDISTHELDLLKAKTLEYYKELHAPFLDALEQSIKDCVNDELYPKVSVVLSIFNKESTIISLLEHLTTACLSYGNAELQIIFDGCKDNTQSLTREFMKNFPALQTTFHVTDNIWEVKSNNLGLHSSSGRYRIILQDDNFVYDKDFLFEVVGFFEKNPTAVVVGGLAGVNFYPRGTSLPNGPGQIANNADEVYWRQDTTTDATLAHKIFEVDACMRGPFCIRASFLLEHGFLDEIYAPLYDDDMDLCFRAKSLGYKVYCILLDVENKDGTVATYDSAKAKFFQKMITKNSDIFYSRWIPSIEKNYLKILRPTLYRGKPKNNTIKTFMNKLLKPFSFIQRATKKLYRLNASNVKAEGFFNGSRKTISDLVRYANRYTPYIPHYVQRVARAIHTTQTDREYLERQTRERPWYQANGDETHRVDYDLEPGSLVIDVGGYHGDWVSVIQNKYGSTIHVFEPIRDFAYGIKNRFKNNPSVIVHEKGLGPKNETITIYLAEGGTSIIKSADESVEVEIQDVHEFLKNLETKTVDLIKINIEGAEYDLIHRLIETGDIKNIKNLQVQFHNFVPNAHNRMKELQSLLEKTHHLTYQYDFIWENWERNA